MLYPFLQLVWCKGIRAVARMGPPGDQQNKIIMLCLAAILILASASYVTLNFLANQLEVGLRRVFVPARKSDNAPQIRR